MAGNREAEEVVRPLSKEQIRQSDRKQAEMGQYAQYTAWEMRKVGTGGRGSQVVGNGKNKCYCGSGLR